MTQAILRALQAAMSSVFPTGVDNRMIQRMKAFSLGSMVASAAVSPILHESAGASYKIWLLDILVFFLVSAIFVWLHLEETINYGPFTLIVAAILFFAAPAPRQARFLPREFIPWLPAAIDVFLFTTVYSLPRIVELLRLFQDRPSSDVGESHLMVSQGFYVEPGSIHSWALSSSHREDFVMQSFIAHDVSNMQGSLSRTSSIPSLRESDIDLEEGLHAPRVILYRSGNPNNFHVPSESGVPSSRYPGGPADGSSNQRDETPRPPSPQSEPSQGSHSTIGDLITQPLLGQHSSLPLSI